MAGFNSLAQFTWKQRAIRIAAVTLLLFFFVTLLTGGNWEKGCYGALGAFIGTSIAHYYAGWGGTKP